MEKPQISVLGALDSGLAWLVQRALLGVLAVGLPVLGFLGFGFTYESFFEHGKGILELSRVEVIFLVLLFVLERRFNHYRKLYGYTGWQGIWRIFSALGVGTLLVSIGSLARQRFPELIDPTLLQPLWLSTYLLSIYLATPARLVNPASLNETPLVERPRVEPSISAQDTEAK